MKVEIKMNNLRREIFLKGLHKKKDLRQHMKEKVKEEVEEEDKGKTIILD